jgi:hypothetical protein
MMAIIISADATPKPEAKPDWRFLLNVRWMHNTATGPTVIDEAKPTPIPRMKISNAVTIILPLSSIPRCKVRNLI